MLSYQPAMPSFETKCKFYTDEIYKLIHCALFFDVGSDFLNREKVFSQKMFSHLLGFSRNYWANTKLNKTHYSSKLGAAVIELVDNINAENPSRNFLSRVCLRGYVSIEEVKECIKKIKKGLNADLQSQLIQNRNKLHHHLLQTLSISKPLSSFPPHIFTWNTLPHSVFQAKPNPVQQGSDEETLTDMENQAVDVLNQWRGR